MAINLINQEPTELCLQSYPMDSALIIERVGPGWLVSARAEMSGCAPKKVGAFTSTADLLAALSISLSQCDGPQEECKK